MSPMLEVECKLINSGSRVLRRQQAREGENERNEDPAAAAAAASERSSFPPTLNSPTGSKEGGREGGKEEGSWGTKSRGARRDPK